MKKLLALGLVLGLLTGCMGTKNIEKQDNITVEESNNQINKFALIEFNMVYMNGHDGERIAKIEIYNETEEWIDYFAYDTDGKIITCAGFNISYVEQQYSKPYLWK